MRLCSASAAESEAKSGLCSVAMIYGGRDKDVLFQKKRDYRRAANTAGEADEVRESLDSFRVSQRSGEVVRWTRSSPEAEQASNEPRHVESHPIQWVQGIRILPTAPNAFACFPCSFWVADGR